MPHGRWLRKTVRLAVKNVRHYKAEPFAAIVVKNNSIVGQGANLVDERKDPTAHAEIEALREACQVLGTADLSGCILYASGEPCPMCMGAIYWSGIQAVYYAYSLADAAAVRLDYSTEIYRQLALPAHERSIHTVQIDDLPVEQNPLQIWQAWAAQQP